MRSATSVARTYHDGGRLAVRQQPDRDPNVLIAIHGFLDRIVEAWLRTLRYRSQTTATGMI